MSSRPSSLYLVLLLVSALFVSISAVTVPERAYAAVALTNIVPNPQAPGFTVQVVGSTTVMTNVASCRVTADNPAIIKSGSATCTFGPTVAGTTPIYASFVVANVWGSPPQYNLFLQTLTSGAAVVESSAATPFAVTQTVWLSTSVAIVGQTVNVAGLGFLLGDNPCSLAYGSAAPFGTFTCNVGANGVLTASFVVATTAAVPDTIIVTGASGLDTITVFPFLWVVTAPTIVLDPTSGAPGFGTLPTDGSGRVRVVGAGFSTSAAARSCTLTPLTGLFATSPTAIAPSCSISTDGSVTGYFAVSKTAVPGGFTVTVTDSATTETASAAFTVNPRPDIWFPVAATGVAGDNIPILTATTSFSPLEAGACTVSATGPGTLYTSSLCWIDLTGAVDFWGMSRFIVGNTAPGGAYWVTVTGYRGEYTAPIAFGVLPAATLSPSSGSPPVGGSPGAAATEVTITGTGFPSSDTGCALVAVAGLVYDTTGEPCTVNSNGQLNVRFRVGATSVYSAAAYTIKVKTTTYPAGFTVTPNFMVQPQIVLSPNSGSASTTVSVSGSGFTGVANPCGITPATIVTAGYICTQAGDGTINGQFSVKSPAPIPGSYFITVIDQGGAPPSAQALFVITGGPSIAFSPTVGPTGTTVTVTSPSGGWNSLDTSVTLTKHNGPPGSVDLWIMPNPTCTVSGGSIGACSFTVKPNAVGGMWTITITGNKGDTVDAQFMLIATLVLSPTNGGMGVTVAMSGSGYSSAAGDCTGQVTSIPGGVLFGDGAGPFLHPATCNLDADGVLTGSFMVNTAGGGAPPGSYTVQFQSAAKVPQTTVTAGFTVTSPQITVSPTSGSGGDKITVAGSGFSSGDTSCTIKTTVSGVIASQSCSISNGQMTGWFVVATPNNPANPTIGLNVTGNLLDHNPTPYPTFAVVPEITLTPNTNVRVGTSITISGSNFAAGDGGLPCGVTSTPTGAVAAAPAPVCNIANDFTITTASQFTLDPTAAASSYTITVTGTGVPKSYASATLGVMPHVVTFSPTYGPIGASISVKGTGFSLGDTCPASVIVGFPFPVGAPVGCSAASGGTITGSFVVVTGSTPGSYSVTLMGSDGDSGSASFTVTPGISLLPATGRAGTNVLVTGSNFASPADTGCTISSTPSGLISSGSLCTVAGGVMSGAFTVASGTSGLYTVNVAGTSGDTGNTTFTVPAAATMTLSLAAGPSGTAVTASGSNFAGTTCSMTSSPGGLFISSSCSLSSGNLMPAGSGFVVSSSAVVGTSYTVTVTSNLGISDSATAPFTVTAGPPGTLTLTPTSGPTGTVVSGSATGFTTDVSCLLSAAPSTILSSPSCTITGSGNAAVGFTVASSAASGDYKILAVGNTGKAATANFTVTAPAVGPVLTLSASTSGPHTVVTVSGSHYAGSTCTTLTSSPSGLLSSPTCSISSGTLTGSFTVAPGASGTYSVAATTDVASDSAASATFTVTAPVLTLTPVQGSAGTPVTASGLNYAATGACTLSSSPAGLLASPTCSISATGTLTGGFTVASPVTPTTYTVTVTTSFASDTTYASFTVPHTTLTLSPLSAAAGTAVAASGSNYQGTGTCTLSSSPSGLFTSSSCSISAGTLTGAFTVASGAIAGSYSVSVATNVASDATSTIFSVTTTPRATFSLSPDSGAAGAAVTVSGSDYVGTGSCSLSSSPSGLLSSSTCSISAGTLTGSFTVASTATPESYSVMVTTNSPSDTPSPASFTVTSPSIPVLPKCVIATATFGSEASPAVQFLRNFRDNLVLKTNAGSAFMQVFNAWYYSFSPTVAQFIANNYPIRAPVRVFLYPLLGVLGISAFTYSLFSASPEFAVVIAGLVASSLIGLVYLTLPAILGFRALTRRRIRIAKIAKASLAVLGIALGLLVAGELAGLFLLLAVAGAVIVLDCLMTVPAVVALVILRRNAS